MVLSTIEPMEKSMTARRPMRSASVPKMIAPSGRAAKPTAKTASADMVSVTELPDGK